MDTKERVEKIADAWQRLDGSAAEFAEWWKEILAELKEREFKGQYKPSKVTK